MKSAIKTLSVLFVLLFTVTSLLPVLPAATGNIEESSVKEETQIVSDIVIDPVDPAEPEEPVEPEPVEPKTTEKKTAEKTTEEKTNEKTKPEKQPSDSDNKTEEKKNTGNGNNANAQNNQNVNANVNYNTRSQNTEQKVSETEEEKLPEGQFFVYLELNNGEKRLKHIMKGAGLVPEPDEPRREGFVFDGWYADDDFKTPWYFSSDIAEKSTVIYAKWVAKKSTVLTSIKVLSSVGGKIEVNPSKASEGETVNITVLPDEGKRLKTGSLKINGKKTDFFTFSMPKGTVEIQAEFEDIPAVAQTENSKVNLVPIIIVLAVLVAAAVVFFVIRKNKQNDTEEVWFDDTITVEDAFKDREAVSNSEQNSFDDITDDELAEGNGETPFDGGDETV